MPRGVIEAFERYTGLTYGDDADFTEAAATIGAQTGLSTFVSWPRSCSSCSSSRRPPGSSPRGPDPTRTSGRRCSSPSSSSSSPRCCSSPPCPTTSASPAARPVFTTVLPALALWFAALSAAYRFRLLDRVLGSPGGVGGGLGGGRVAPAAPPVRTDQPGLRRHAPAPRSRRAPWRSSSPASPSSRCSTSRRPAAGADPRLRRLPGRLDPGHLGVHRRAGPGLLVLGPLSDRRGRTSIVHAGWPSRPLAVAVPLAPLGFLLVCAPQGVALAALPAVGVAYLREDCTVDQRAGHRTVHRRQRDRWPDRTAAGRAPRRRRRLAGGLRGDRRPRGGLHRRRAPAAAAVAPVRPRPRGARWPAAVAGGDRSGAAGHLRLAALLMGSFVAVTTPRPSASRGPTGCRRRWRAWSSSAICSARRPPRPAAGWPAGAARGPSSRCPWLMGGGWRSPSPHRWGCSWPGSPWSPSGSSPPTPSPAAGSRPAALGAGRSARPPRSTRSATTPGPRSAAPSPAGLGGRRWPAVVLFTGSMTAAALVLTLVLGRTRSLVAD